jgi:aldehyde:ferredoxin oxidoreductase
VPNFELKEIASFSYERPEIDKGYANQTLSLELSKPAMEVVPVDEEMKQTFVGGKGFDLWMTWNQVDGNTKWDDPQNPICIACGPLGGTPTYPGSGKSIVTTISPLTEMIIDSNVGGYFGPYLKFSGFDAMMLTGKSDKELVVFIDGLDETIKVFESSGLADDGYCMTSELTAHFGGDKPRNISVVSSGPGAKNTRFGCLNFSWFDVGRKRARYKQAGRGGIGTVFADKGIKALVCRWGGVSLNLNAPADKESLTRVAKAHSQEIRELDPKQNEMAKIGTTHLVTIMNDHDTLPVHNFRYGSHKEAPNLGQAPYRLMFDPGYDGCWMGCTVACSHGVKDFNPFSGPYAGKQVFVDGPEYETIAGCGSSLGIFDPSTVVEINFYCDAYGLDTISVGTAIAFVMECYEMGLITKEHTGGLEMNFGNRMGALEIIHQMARGKGFGAIVGQGVRRMKKYFAENFGSDPKMMADIGMEAKGLEFSEYISKESLAQQGGYGLALKGPQHDEAWLIFLDAVHNLMPTFDQKAENLHWFPMFRTWFSLCGLCKLPWNDIVPLDNKDMPEPAKVMKHIEWYAEFFSSVTGRKEGPEDLVAMSEKVYNFQRVFNLRMGFGTREHDAIPYRAQGPVTPEEYESRAERYDGQLKEKVGIDPEGMSTPDKVAALRKYREDQYSLLQDAVYERRGWTQNGIPTLATVKRLGIDYPDVVELLKANGVTE